MIQNHHRCVQPVQRSTQIAGKVSNHRSIYSNSWAIYIATEICVIHQMLCSLEYNFVTSRKIEARARCILVFSFMLILTGKLDAHSEDMERKNG